MKKIIATVLGLALAASAFAVTGTYVQVTCNTNVSNSSAVVSDASGTNQTYATCGQALASLPAGPGTNPGYYLKDGSSGSNYVSYLFTNS